MESIAKRLRWAIDRQEPVGRRRGKGLLIHKLDQAGAPGANYPTLNSYLKERDPVSPPLDFLTAAADALDVRVEWLAFGTGPRMPVEEEGSPLADAARAGFPDMAHLANRDVFFSAIARGVARRLVGREERPAEEELPPLFEEAARELGEWLAAPLGDSPAWGSRGMGRYEEAALLALNLGWDSLSETAEG